MAQEVTMSRNQWILSIAALFAATGSYAHAETPNYGESSVAPVAFQETLPPSTLPPVEVRPEPQTTLPPVDVTNDAPPGEGNTPTPFDDLPSNFPSLSEQLYEDYE